MCYVVLDDHVNGGLTCIVGILSSGFFVSTYYMQKCHSMHPYVPYVADNLH